MLTALAVRLSMPCWPVRFQLRQSRLRHGRQSAGHTLPDQTICGAFMATGKEVQVVDALFSHLSGLTTTPATTIIWHGRRAVNPVFPYLEVMHLPNRTFSPTFGAARDLRGLLQVTVVYEAKGAGPGILAPGEIASQIVTRFAKNTDIWGDVKVSIPNWPSVAPAILEGDEIRIPVTIPYLSSIGD